VPGIGAVDRPQDRPDVSICGWNWCSRSFRRGLPFGAVGDVDVEADIIKKLGVK